MRQHPKSRKHVSVGYALLIGAVLGALLGFIWGWLDYGSFEIGYMSNHVLGGAVILGAVFAAAALLMNWIRRNPM